VSASVLTQAIATVSRVLLVLDLLLGLLGWTAFALGGSLLLGLDLAVGLAVDLVGAVARSSADFGSASSTLLSAAALRLRPPAAFGAAMLLPSVPRKAAKDGWASRAFFLTGGHIFLSEPAVFPVMVAIRS
jgi:hypothetical protein